MLFSLSVTPSAGDGIVSVSGSPIDLENGSPFFNENGDPIFTLVGADTADELLASDANIPPQDAIGVTNSVNADTSNLGGTFALRTYEQRFNQTPIPEESSPWSLMLGIGALGAGSVVSKALKSKSNS